MDREIKSPYAPPKEKMISDDDIKKMANANKKVIDEIRVIIKLFK